MGRITERSRTLGEAMDYSIDVLGDILTDLRPYVWVVGSYGNDCPSEVSDIDLMPRRKPYEVYEIADNEEQYYFQEIRNVLAKWGLKDERQGMLGTWSVFWHRHLDIYQFDIPKDAVKVTKVIPYLGIEMDCLEYDRSQVIKDYDVFESDWEDWELE